VWFCKSINRPGVATKYRRLVLVERLEVFDFTPPKITAERNHKFTIFFIGKYLSSKFAGVNIKARIGLWLKCFPFAITFVIWVA
jgi:hypothetical protein